MKDNKTSQHTACIVFADDGFGNLMLCPVDAIEFNWHDMYDGLDIYFGLV